MDFLWITPVFLLISPLITWESGIKIKRKEKEKKLLFNEIVDNFSISSQKEKKKNKQKNTKNI